MIARIRRLGLRSRLRLSSGFFYSTLALTLTFFAAGCRQQMAEQPRYDPLEASAFFPDGQSARPLVEGTVARGTLCDDEHLYTGISGGAPAAAFPFPITLEVLQRGRERYDIYCSPCHSRTGHGDGMIARRGFGPPASLHTDVLRKQPPGHFFRVITQGFGAMPPYSQQIAPADRWAIIAYLRALQLSQNASVNDVPSQSRDKLEGELR
jgi:mono/diheme cytochrome c family protein